MLMRKAKAQALLKVIQAADNRTGHYEVSAVSGKAALERYRWVRAKCVLGAMRVVCLGATNTLVIFVTLWRDSRPGDYYIIAFDEKNVGSPLAELADETEDGQALRWRYEPRKRDGRNVERKKRFEQEVPDGFLNLALPLNADDADDFLDDLFELVRLRSTADNLSVPLHVTDPWGFPEGRRYLRMHTARERNQELIRRAKDIALNGGRKLTCQVCQFDFREKYGQHGEGFIEAHHTIPVSELEEGAVTRVEDIALVCANCHRMLHRRRPWLAMGHLRDLIAKAG